MKTLSSNGFLLVTLATAAFAAACADDPPRRVAAVFSWKRDGSPASLARIRELLADSDAGVRAAALDALVSSATPDAPASAIAALEDPDAAVRAVAVKGLGELRVPSVEPALIHVLETDSEAQVRRTAAQSLEILGGEAAGSAIAEALSDPSREVRLAATRGCTRLQSADCFESLARVILDDPEWEVRVAAARGLGRSGRQEGSGALEAATADPNEFVRAAAASALAALAKRPSAPPGARTIDPAGALAKPPPGAKAPRTKPAPRRATRDAREAPRSRRRSPPPRGVYSALRCKAADAPPLRRETNRASG